MFIQTFLSEIQKSNLYYIYIPSSVMEFKVAYIQLKCSVAFTFVVVPDLERMMQPSMR